MNCTYVSFIIVMLYEVLLKLKFEGELVSMCMGEGEKKLVCMGDRDERVRVESVVCVCF